ncbi:Hepatocyte nuclear factor 1-alpha, partial [Geodia barretti]
MENTTISEQAADAPSEQEAAFCIRGEANGCSQQEREDLGSAKYEVKRTLRSLVERFGLSREDLVSAYDECLQEGDGRGVRVERNGAATKFTAAVEGGEPELHEQQQKRLAEHPIANGAIAEARKRSVNGALTGSELDATVVGDSEAGSGESAAMDVEEEGEEEGLQQTEEEEEQDGEPVKSRRVEAQLWTKQNGTGGGIHRQGSLSDSSPLEEKEEVDKMQTLVQSALRVYEASSTHPEIGQKRRGDFSLEDELLQPSPFVQELLDRDQTVVAHAIKKYMNQYSVPQREVVEKTGLNQSHLSQHFLHGVTMKRSKRVKLYHWFEDDQRIRTGKSSTADSALNSVLESPKVEGSRRRPRWKWSPISTQILSEAFKKVRRDGEGRERERMRG